MSKKMYANFSDKAYNALMNGEAVDNNGLRSTKGSFYPDQPSYEPISEGREQSQGVGSIILIAAGGYVVFDIILPEAKRFAHEKVYPYVAEIWDSWQDKHRMKKSKKHNTKVECESSLEGDKTERTKMGNNCRLIRFEEYRKMA